MVAADHTADIHDLEVTVWVGKAGPAAVADELEAQLADRELVKVRFLRSALGGTTAEEAAKDLADAVDATVIDVRGHTAVYQT